MQSAALTQSDLAAFGALYEQTFETPASNTETIIRDRRVRLMPGVGAPQSQWYYMQMNTGLETKLYRQRVVEFGLSDDKSAIIQITHRIKTSEAYEDVWDKPDVLAAFGADAIEPYFPNGCEQRWSRSGAVWTGYVDPKTCKIFSQRRGAHIRIESESRLSGDLYQTTERGFDEDGEFLWGSKPGEFIDMFPAGD